MGDIRENGSYPINVKTVGFAGPEINLDELKEEIATWPSDPGAPDGFFAARLTRIG